MTERQKYRVLQEFEGFQTREYSPAVLADVVITSNRASADNQGFRPLFNYISTNNIQMTSPVLKEEIAKDEWKISFVMPADMDLTDLPQPTNSPVTLRHVQSETVAALRFSGEINDLMVKDKEQKLRSLMKLQGLIPIGSSRTARFNPPWIPAFMRHNELLIPFTNL